MKYANDSLGDGLGDLEQLSALVDGELDAQQTAALVQVSQDSPQLLQTWSSYHAIGDVLRASARDAQSARIGIPVTVEAKQPALQAIPLAANDSVFRWKLVAGIAALAAVGSVVWSMVGTLDQGAQWAQRDGTSATALARSSTSPDAALAQISTASSGNPVMIRDPRLDELLAAHKQFGGASALQQPAGFLRNATFQPAGR
jgi:sigma-E factor negative regulatory protein RseA